ncbi:MAG: hypothetical protein WC758_02030 [Candidatus Woesearchaeota archaeon]|jgi:predicted ATP-grasp superfamily ATP-dependent carboligase
MKDSYTGSTAYILGCNGRTSVGIARSLGAEKIKSVALDVQNARVSNFKYSRSFNEEIILNDYDAIVHKLVNLGKTLDKKGVLFASNDLYVDFCEKYRDELKNYFHVPELPGRSLNYFMNKNNILDYAKSLGFDVPNHTNLEESNNLNFPIIIKPLHTIINSKSDICFVANEKSLIEDVFSFKEKFKNMAFQEYVVAESRDHIEIQAYNSKLKGPIIAGMHKKIHISKSKCDHAYPTLASTLESTWVPDLEENVKKIVANLNFNSALNMEFIWDNKSNTYKFIEVNFRHGSNVFLDTISGLNLPAIIYRDLSEDENNSQFKDRSKFSELLVKKRREGVKLIHESNELLFVIFKRWFFKK